MYVLLIQKRSLRKDGKYASTGGHAKTGENSTQAMMTEIKEELGVDVSESELEVFSEGCDGVDCYKMYYLKTDYDLNDFVIQKEELTEVRWFSMQELQNMVKQKILNPNQIACFEKCVNYLKTK